MSILQAIVLGLTQGITEFAPISSSGHLILVPWLFGWDKLGSADLDKAFDVALHVGTLVGAVLYFRTDLWRYLQAWLGSIRHRRIASTDERLAWALVIGTIPGAVVGATFEGLIQDELGAAALIAVMLAVFGVVLYLVDKRLPQTRSIEDVTVRHGLILGVAQAVALQPGVSRSGVTITAGRLLKLDRASAARFSFLLSIPIIAGAGLYEGVDLVRDGFPSGSTGVFVAGMISAAISGFAVIAFLLSYLRRRDFAVFMWYRLGLAALVLLLIATGVRPSVA
ncbi:MAG: undecaprenyl-diphosphatase UppP [Actinomycetota bacterium]